MDPRDALLERLAGHRVLGHAPRAEHEWLVDHGELRSLPVGGLSNQKMVQSPELVVIFTGRLVIRADRGAGAQKLFEFVAGGVGGRLPYSRSSAPPGDVIAEEATEYLAVAREHFPELIRECPVVTAALVHAMLDRARMFTSNDLRDEKLISLGKLSAGLAHELNNPASAVVRGAKRLAESLDASEVAARRLGAAGLSKLQLAAIDAVRAFCRESAPSVAPTAIERADREDMLAEWLLAHGADDRCAGPLAETGITIDALDALASTVNGDALDATLKWIAAGCNVRALTAEIETAALRITDLVGAVKGFTYMDHAPTPEPVDIRKGITDTLTMLGAKLRAKSVNVALDLPDDLPRAHAVGAELNQVWMNLIDNALDAVAPNGRISVSATVEIDRVVVRVIDDGAGIPKEHLARVFDPFFTTKGVGQGTGLGLDIVRRLLMRHEGGIAVESEPGRTEFQVRLPMET